VPTEPRDCDMSWFVFVVRLTDDFSTERRDRILMQMAGRNIQVSNYFPPVHLMPFIANQFGYQEGDFPVTESTSQRTIALPFHNHLTKDEVAIVCQNLREALDDVSTIS
jgi:perosamine synthetase